MLHSVIKSNVTHLNYSINKSYIILRKMQERIEYDYFAF